MGDSQNKRKGSISIHDARIAGLYDLEKTIGKGHFAVVKLASHVFTGEKVAVKVIDKSKFDEKMAAHFMQEVRCMKLVQHPNIVRLYEVIDTQTKLFLILELGDYDMYDFIMRNADKGCSECDAQQYFFQIIKAIDYCHKLHVVHRDLKPENVVFFEKLSMVKLTDFGFSNKFTPGEQLATSCGSLAYSAPEILLGDAYDAPAVDVWSLGVILYMLLCGRLPFQEANDSETLTKILDCKYTLPDYLSPQARHLISRMLVKDPEKRATLKEILANPWVAAGERGLAQILPLVGRDVLPESAHTTIIEQMVAGGVDTEDHILRSLENDDYSYATATYYLLAERVLSSYREERVRQVLAYDHSPVAEQISDAENHNENSDATAPSTATGTRCRSRSNSWRGGTSVPRRPCTILKEESEEELSTYLRSSSRQSSRYFQWRRSNGGSRASSTDSLPHHRPKLQRQKVIYGIDEGDSLEAESCSQSAAPPSGSPTNLSPKGGVSFSVTTSFDELSPICEFGSSSFAFMTAEDEMMGVRLVQKRTWSAGDLREAGKADQDVESGPKNISKLRRRASEALEDRRKIPFVCFRRSASSLGRIGNCQPVQSTSAVEQLCSGSQQPLLKRRNSSPSVSTFGPLSASRERVSPQTIQGLLELSRMNIVEGRRRAASPAGRASRSPSPPSSTGRTSPAFGITRMKTMPGAGGMRKLSSSPHLLGICEESEEPEFAGVSQQRQAITRRSISSVSAISPLQPRTQGVSKATSESGMLTYNKVRVIRPRQAVVSPDMALRYEPHIRHRFPSARTRRSTSCSSSETSDDDSSERRMNLLVSRCCRCCSDTRGDDDDPSGGGGGFIGGGDACTEHGNLTTARNAGTQGYNAPGGSSMPKSRAGDATDAAVVYSRPIDLYELFDGLEYGRQITSTPLHPIMEFPTFLSDTNCTWKEGTEQNTANRICTCKSEESLLLRKDRKSLSDDLDDEFLRSLHISVSLPLISAVSPCGSCCSAREEDVFSDEELDSLSWTSTDSGCLSDSEPDCSSKPGAEKNTTLSKDIFLEPAECSTVILS